MRHPDNFLLQFLQRRLPQCVTPFQNWLHIASPNDFCTRVDSTNNRGLSRIDPHSCVVLSEFCVALSRRVKYRDTCFTGCFALFVFREAPVTCIRTCKNRSYKLAADGRGRCRQHLWRSLSLPSHIMFFLCGRDRFYFYRFFVHEDHLSTLFSLLCKSILSAQERTGAGSLDRFVSLGAPST